MTATLNRPDIAAVVSEHTCWADVVGFEDFYAVARPDRVKSLDRYVVQGSRHGHPVATFHRGRELAPYITRAGRRRVILHADGRRFCRYADDLVREAFGDVVVA